MNILYLMSIECEKLCNWAGTVVIGFKPDRESEYSLFYKESLYIGDFIGIIPCSKIFTSNNKCIMKILNIVDNTVPSHAILDQCMHIIMYTHIRNEYQMLSVVFAFPHFEHGVEEIWLFIERISSLITKRKSPANSVILHQPIEKAIITLYTDINNYDDFILDLIDLANWYKVVKIPNDFKLAEVQILWCKDIDMKIHNDSLKPVSVDEVKKVIMNYMQY